MPPFDGRSPPVVHHPAMSSSPDLDGIKAEPSYEPDTDEVQSLDSEVLHRYRPNRWSGFRQHWLELTEAERLDAQALDNIRKQDLSAHLYNAFAIKSRAKAALSAPPRTRGVSPSPLDFGRNRIID